eukprot:SAG11_NODE_78_length_17939_cov_10.236883_7_plen_59_part_00
MLPPVTAAAAALEPIRTAMADLKSAEQRQIAVQCAATLVERLEAADAALPAVSSPKIH